MATVKNDRGTEVNFEVAANLMDGELCEGIETDTEQEYFDAYCEAHEQKYGEPFEFAKLSPVA